ncbi:YbaK/prolyl-tRNA synthetase associated region [Halalkaliarchaeum desulfuricum]|uniref:YbaK/prolyl-tRNA synthetase associated region n=1 Tax=Halalkaliarchaeum desulfuricum TaxID=2055893 RepID=A0A343THH7_9EURY|nr:YbaK/EbsC family protein [Halalkaliarchaeum desulfuricum]AUX08549.1 YbaK/prolyl-tRNA synthetase associated region [Halalkaliarchaeum desulfuricum]
MHSRAEAFAEQATQKYGLDIEVLEFPAGTKTAADAAEALGCDVAQIASSIVVDADGDLIVAITSGANRVDLAAVAERFDAPVERTTMADPDRVADEIGWSIGGVPPICHETDVPVLFDPALQEFETVYAAAGTPEAVFPIDPETLREHASATVVDVTESR